MNDFDNAQLLQPAAAILADWLNDRQNPEPHGLDLAITPEQLLPIVARLHEAWWGYLVAITGLDEGAAANQITVLYHFANGPAILTLRLIVPRDNACVPSLCGLIPSASFYERELREMFGVTVTGTPNTDYLFLPDEWPEGVYPLRKDFVPEAIASN